MSKILSVFVDESGDLGFKKGSSDFYILSFVFHDQRKEISANLSKLEPFPVFHGGPLIRREKPYEQMDVQERRRIFHRFFLFAQSLPIRVNVLNFDKKYFSNQKEFIGKMLQATQNMLTKLKEIYFVKFDSINLYYDRGQNAISSLLAAAFLGLGTAYRFKENVKPEHYRLFQVADFVSTIKLFELKNRSGILTQSESHFIKQRIFKKVYLKWLDKRIIK